MTAVEPLLDGTSSRWLCLQRAGVMVVLDVGGPSCRGSCIGAATLANCLTTRYPLCRWLASKSAVIVPQIKEPP